MIHEVLLALSGFPGDIIVEDDSKFRVVSTLPFLHPGESSALNRLASLGYLYKNFRSFCKAYNSPIRDSTPNSGLYLTALASSLDRALQPYRDLLLETEKEALQGHLLTISDIQNRFEKFHLLFPVLDEFLARILEQNVHGCQMLSLLYQYCNSGIILINNTFQRLLKDSHAVLYKQLSSWFLHGTLLDFNSEFFIAESVAEVTEDESTEAQATVGRHFVIAHGLLPSYIPLRLAEKILFIGEAVHMLFGQKRDSHVVTSADKGSLLKSEEKRFLSDISHLSQEDEFNLMKFEEVIDGIKLFVGERLWEFAVKESNLFHHLKLMRDFFLLGRGELFRTFIEIAQDLMRLPPSKTTENDVNFLFTQAAHKVFSDDDENFRRFSLVIKDNEQEVVCPSWELLGMDCTASWPLQILFTPSSFQKYNSVFKFLLRVKRVQMSLQHAWAQQMEFKSMDQPRDDSFLKGLWNLRNQMAFLVDNLQYYLQVNVLESQYSIMLAKIEETNDFEEVCLAHDAFLCAIQEQSFLLMRPISHSLNEILDLCLQLSTLLSYGLHLTERDFSQAGKIAKAFERQSSLLFKILCSVQTRQSSSHLAQFLLKVDYNFFFSEQLSGKRLPSALL